jgi:hypothetical protein
MAKKKESAQDSGSHYVVQPFRSINNWDDEYFIGQDVSHLSDDRLLDLMEKGMVTDDAEVIAGLPKEDENPED